MCGVFLCFSGKFLLNFCAASKLSRCLFHGMESMPEEGLRRPGSRNGLAPNSLILGKSPGSPPPQVSSSRQRSGLFLDALRYVFSPT